LVKGGGLFAVIASITSILALRAGKGSKKEGLIFYALTVIRSIVI